MDLTFPVLTSRGNKLSHYCNFIEYTCFINEEMEFNEFDVSEDALQFKDVIAELERRLILYGSFIPYVIKKDKIITNITDKHDYLHYCYCLYYSIVGGTFSKAITNLFEEITDISLLNYFGGASSHITSIGQNNENLKKAIENLPGLLNEKKGSFEDIAPQAKDGGIDIITYKPVDNRGNQIVCLTDATIGKHWKSEKTVAVKLNYWSKYLHFKVPPITCLSIVHVIEDSEIFSASNDNGLLFDRTRIMKFFTPKVDLSIRLIQWVSTLSI